MNRALSFERTGTLSRQLSQRILSLSAIAILGLLALVGVGLLAAFQNTQTQLILARETAVNNFTSFLGGLTDDLRATGDALATATNPDELFRRALQRQTAIFELDYLNPAGRVLNQRRRVGQAEGASFAEQPWLETVKAGQTYIGSVDYSEFGVPFITIAVPVVNREGEFQGTLLATTDLTALWRPITSLKIGETGYVYIADESGTLLAFRNLDLVQNNTSIESITGRTPQEIVQAVNNIHPGLGGGLAVASGDALQDVPWFIIVEQPASEALGAFLWLAAILLLLLVFVVFQAASSFRFAQRRIVEPLGLLQAGVQELQTSGRLEQPISIQSKDELGDLAGTFNSMAAQLQDLIGSLEQRVAARTKDLSTVAEVSTAASTILESDKLLQAVVELTKDRFGLYHAHIYLLDESGENLVLAAGAGEPGRIMAAEKRSIPLSRERSLVARAARERQGVTINDVTQEPDFLPNPLLPETRSELAAPMLVGAELVGVFDIQSEQVGRFTESDIAIQTTLASQIASAIQNARLFAQSKTFQERFSLAVEGSNDGIWDWDMTTNNVYFSPRWKEMIGYGENELNNGFADFEALLHPADHDYALAAVNNYLTGKNAAYDLEFRFHHKDGSYRWIRARGKALRDDKGQPYRMAGSHTDITESKLAQDNITRRAEQQEALNLITQKIQGTTSIENALQIAARELGHALGQKRTLVTLDAAVLAVENKTTVAE